MNGTRADELDYVDQPDLTNDLLPPSDDNDADRDIVSLGILEIAVESLADIETSRSSFPPVTALFHHFFKELNDRLSTAPQTQLLLLKQCLVYLNQFQYIDRKYNMGLFRLPVVLGLLSEPHLYTPLNHVPAYFIRRLSASNTATLPTATDCPGLTPFLLTVLNRLVTVDDIETYHRLHAIRSPAVLSELNLISKELLQFDGMFAERI